MTPLTLYLADESETQSVGEKLAQCLHAPLVLTLSGPLGAGKSTLIRAMLRSLGVTGPIKSPTYALVEPYNISNFTIYHFDFYRFFDENEWEDSGFRDYFNAESICLVEWAEKAARVLPPVDLQLEFQYGQIGTEHGTENSQGRSLKIQAGSAQGEVVLRDWIAALSKHPGQD